MDVAYVIRLDKIVQEGGLPFGRFPVLNDLTELQTQQ